MTLVRVKAVLLMAALTFSQTHAQLRGPIPSSSPTESEKEASLLDMRQFLEDDANLTGDELEEEMQFWAAAIDQSYIFREVDIRPFFPELSGSDERVYSCGTARPPSRTFAYLSTELAESSTVRVKTLRCDAAESEMYCEIEESDAIYADDPENFFYVDPTIDIATAIDVIEMYRVKDGDVGAIDSISRSGEHFLLRIGRSGCACHSEVKVRVRGFLLWKRLEVDQNVRHHCV